MRSTVYHLLILLIALGFAPGLASGRDSSGTTLNKVGFDQNLNAQIPLGLTFRDETGRSVTLGDYFGKRPVILALVYYRCPMLCGEELKGLARSLRPLSISVGKDFDIVVVSIDPTETPELASAKKSTFVDRYDRPGSEGGWHFLTGEEPAIAALASTVGFRYTYSPETKLYAHAAGIVVTTPTGRLSRYLYGIDYSPKDLQFALIESSAGKIGTPIARLLLFCYHYDPSTGKYSLAIVGLLQVFGTATALLVGTYVVLSLRRERHRAAASARFPAPNPSAP